MPTKRQSPYILAVKSAYVNPWNFPYIHSGQPEKINKTAAEIVGRKKGRGEGLKIFDLVFQLSFLKDGNDVT